MKNYYNLLLLFCCGLTQAQGSIAPSVITAAATQVTAAATPSVAAPTLTLVVDNYPPYIDELADNQGLLSELVRQVFTTAGIATELSFLPWPRVPEAAAQANRASFLWFKTAELEQNWLFSEPIVELRQVLISTSAMKAELSRFDEFRAYRLGVTKGYFYGASFAAQRQDFRLTEAVSDYASLQNLLAGRVDFVVMDPIIARLMWQQLPGKTAPLRYLQKPLVTAQPAYLVCSRNFLPCHAVIQSFNQALLQLQQSGTDLQILGFGVKTQQ